MNKAFEKILERLDESAICEDNRTCNYCQRTWCPEDLVEREEVEKIIQEVEREYENNSLNIAKKEREDEILHAATIILTESVLKDKKNWTSKDILTWLTELIKGY